MGGIPNNKFIIIERREKVFVMLSQGLNETEISKNLRVNQSTVCRDIKVIKKQSQEVIESVAKEVLPYEFGRCLVSIEQLIKEGWAIYHDKSGKWTNKDKINALKLVKESIRTKLEILLQGPTTLHLQELQIKVNELVEKVDTYNIQNIPGDLLLHHEKTPVF
jgi:hypothetical protein